MDNMYLLALFIVLGIFLYDLAGLLLYKSKKKNSLNRSNLDDKYKI